MLLETSFMVAYGFFLSDEEAHSFSEEQYEELTEDGDLILLSTWHPDYGYVFALSSFYVYEGRAVEIANLTDLASPYLLSIFRTQFPNRATEEPKQFAFIRYR